MNLLKRFLLLSLGIIIFAGTAFAQTAQPWVIKNNASVHPTNPNWTVCSLAQPCANGFFTNLTATNVTIGTINTGQIIIDVTNTEALLVRKDGDTGDVFVVDTTNGGIGVNAAPTSAIALNFAKTFTPAAGVPVGQFNEYVTNPSANGTSIVGHVTRITSEPTDNSNITQFAASQFIARHSGGGLIGEMFGTTYDTVLNGTGNATWTYNAVYRTAISSTGSIVTGGIGAYFPVPTVAGGGSIGNYYSIFIDDVDGISAGNEYVFFYDNGTDGIFMQGDGKIGVGVEFPTVEMDINGQLKTTGSATIGTGATTINGRTHIGGTSDPSAVQLLVTGSAGIGSGGLSALRVNAGAHTDNANAAFVDFNFNGDRTVNFAGGGLDINEFYTTIFSSPTLTADAAQTIQLSYNTFISGFVKGGANMTIDTQAQLVVAEFGSTAGITGDNALGIAVFLPGIANGTGSVSSRSALYFPNSNQDLGNQTATVANLANIIMNDVELSSTTNIRTVTNPAQILIDGNITSTGNVSFSNGPYSIWATVNADPARFDVIVQGLAGMRTKQSVANFSAPPTDAELDAEFGTPATLGRGFFATIDDNDADTDSYFVWTTDGSWYVATGTKAL